MLRNIIWDVDGTLFDTYPSIVRAFRGALIDLGQDAPLDRIETLARESLSHCVSVLAASHGLPADDLERAFQQRYSLETAVDSPPFPGAINVCRYIASIGGRNVIATHRSRAGTRALLEAHGMATLFAGMLAGDDGYPRKPDPAIFEAAMTQFDLGRAETITVGDRDIDIQAGLAAGIRTCRYAPGGGEELGSEHATPDLVVRHLDQLGRYLVEVNRRKEAVR